MTSLDLAFDEEFENTPHVPSKKQKSIEDYQQLSQSSHASHASQPPQQHPQPLPPQQHPQPQPQPQAQTKEHFNNYYPYQEQAPVPQSQMRIQQTYQYSFWDRMVMSRREVMKLFILSIVIILGISLEKIGCHYINEYLTSNDLTYIQELLVRFSFPIIVFIILWIIKSL
jgi:hypothetical protein